jgi:hypothetical protein
LIGNSKKWKNFQTRISDLLSFINRSNIKKNKNKKELNNNLQLKISNTVNLTTQPHLERISIFSISYTKINNLSKTKLKKAKILIIGQEIPSKLKSP